MKKLCPLKKIILILIFPFLLFSQRGETGDEVFKDKFPPNVYNRVSNSSLTISNNVDHDVIVLIRGKYFDNRFFFEKFNPFIKAV